MILIYNIHSASILKSYEDCRNLNLNELSKSLIVILQYILIMNLRYVVSVSPKDDGDTLLVKNSLIVSAFHLQTHNQILSCAIQIHRNHHLVSRNGLRCHLAPAHQHRRQSLTDILFLSDRDYLIAIRPVSTLDSHSGHQQRFLIEGLPTQLLSTKL